MSAREPSAPFEVIVGRIATRDLAYVWRVENGERKGIRLTLKRALVTDERGRLVDIAEGMHLTVSVDPARPTRVTLARVV